MEEVNHKHTELIKLQHVLNDDKNELSFLDELKDEQLVLLRIKISEAIQMEQSSVWSKIAKVTVFMPNIVNAKVAETILDPMITANISYHIEVKEAIGIIRYLSVPFMAKVAEHLIPERSVQLLNALSMDLLKKLVTQLLKTESYFTLAGFVEVTDKKKVLELSNYIRSDEDLLKISHYVNNKKILVYLIDAFSDSKLKSLIQKSTELNLHQEILLIAVCLSEKQIHRITSILYDLPLPTLDKLLQKTEEMQFDEQLKPLKASLIKQLNI